MYERKAARPAMGGFVVLVPSADGEPDKVFYGLGDTPAFVTCWLVPGKRTCIGHSN